MNYHDGQRLEFKHSGEHLYLRSGFPGAERSARQPIGRLNARKSEKAYHFRDTNPVVPTPLGPRFRPENALSFHSSEQRAF